jgi:hypothetical protein
MSVDVLLARVELVGGWLDDNAPMWARLLALLALLLIWYRVRDGRGNLKTDKVNALKPDEASNCRRCGEGYRLDKLAPAARDGAQMCVRCPSCGSWYAMATTSRDVFKVDEGYVSARWPQAIAGAAHSRR